MTLKVANIYECWLGRFTGEGSELTSLQPDLVR